MDLRYRCGVVSIHSISIDIATEFQLFWYDLSSPSFTCSSLICYYNFLLSHDPAALIHHHSSSSASVQLKLNRNLRKRICVCTKTIRRWQFSSAWHCPVVWWMAWDGWEEDILIKRSLSLRKLNNINNLIYTSRTIHVYLFLFRTARSPYYYDTHSSQEFIFFNNLWAKYKQKTCPPHFQRWRIKKNERNQTK